MIRKIAAPICFALLSTALLATSPAKAGYDPCARATRDMIVARTAYDNATCNPRNCSGDTRYWALHAAYLRAYERMRQQCR